MSYVEKKAVPSGKGTVIPLIIPAYEPDERMITLLSRLAAEYEDEIVVVNDGSGPAYDSLYAQAVELGFRRSAYTGGYPSLPGDHAGPWQ